MSATLLASLFTVIAASSALAAVSVTSVGNIPRGGSATGLVYTLTESSAGCLPNAAGSATIIIAPNGGGTTVSYTGTPVVSAPGSLGATASASGQTLTINWTGSDPLNIESITVSGLGISATTAAALGAISATLATTPGALLACFQAGGTASGTIASGIAIGALSVIVNVTTPGCLFVPTGAPPPPGQLTFVQNPESVNITAAVAGPGIGQQTLTIAATTAVHDAATGVSQSTACAPSGVLASPGTVVDSLIYNAPTQLTVVPGENNQPAGNLSVTERVGSAGFLSAGTTLTFTIATAGVTFSTAPSASITSGTLTGTVGVMTPDLKSVTWTIATASAVPATLTVTGIRYDVAASVPAGTQVSVGLVLSGGKVVTPTSRSNAVVGRVVVGVGATPTVYIGENNQPSGMITLTESGAGFLTDGTGPNNVFTLCLASGETFTLAPWAIVTGPATGAVRLREGAVASPDNIVLGTLFTSDDGRSCAYWTVWTASTAASTIEIRATDPAAPGAPLPSGANNGPRLSVGPGLAPGTTQAGISFGDFTDIVTDNTAADYDSLVVFAVRAFRSGVNVVALSAPTIIRGGTSLAGNIQISETLAGQLKAGDLICLQVQPRASNFSLQDTWFDSATTNKLPIATATGGGLAVGPVAVGGASGCPTGPGGDSRGSAGFTVTQQAVGTLGVITVSNINYITVADAPTGSVLLRVFSTFGPGVDFSSFVVNAKIGSTAVGGSNATRLGVTQTGAFTISTKVAKVGKYVTYRFDFGVAAAGQIFVITGATKTGNDWSAFTTITSRRANASGVVYYYIRQNSATWKSYRASWSGGGVITLARQSRWIP